MMRKRSRIALLVGLLCLTLGASSALAAPDEYDDSQSHPLRIAAYLLHPVGVITEWVIFRPFHWLVSANEPLETLFGHRPHPPLLGEPLPARDYGTPRRRAVVPPPPQPPAPAPLPPPESVRIIEVPVERIVVKEVEKPVRVEVERLVFPPVAFAFDSARLTDLGRGQVYLAAQRFKDNANVAIAIEGHADNRGDEQYNLKLGLRRAETVMNELAALGVARERMSTVSLGESRPAVETDAAWARAVNRRVEFQLHAAP